jgi:hypothetical protein
VLTIQSVVAMLSSILRISLHTYIKSVDKKAKNDALCLSGSTKEVNMAHVVIC